MGMKDWGMIKTGGKLPVLELAGMAPAMDMGMANWPSLGLPALGMHMVGQA